LLTKYQGIVVGYPVKYINDIYIVKTDNMRILLSENQNQEENNYA